MNESARADGHGNDFVQGEQTFKALKLRLIVLTRKIADFIFSTVRELFCAGNETCALRNARINAECCCQAYISLDCFSKILLGVDYGKREEIMLL